MPKILIVSDSHGDLKYLRRVLHQVKPVDLFIHLGDVEGDAEAIRDMSGCPAEIIAGNNDHIAGLPCEKFIKIGNYKVYMTHGHRASLFFGIKKLLEEAMMQGADIVMFGHTHRPLVMLESPVWAVNPGSISRPRQAGGLPSYILMDLDRRGEAHFTINYVDI